MARIQDTCVPALADAGEVCENLFFYCAGQALVGAFPANACSDAGR